MDEYITGQSAIEAAGQGCTLYFYDGQRGWIVASAPECARAKRAPSHDLWVYGVKREEWLKTAQQPLPALGPAHKAPMPHPTPHGRGRSRVE